MSENIAQTSGSGKEPEMAIEMRDIVKKFGDFTANDHINLKVHGGEVHAILGENGAGKSTLMNVLYGLYRPTSGEIYVRGKRTEIRDPSHAIRLGIGMVHQHFMLVQPFTVTENIVLGDEPMRGLMVDIKTARKRVMELSERYAAARRNPQGAVPRRGHPDSRRADGVPDTPGN